LPRCLECLAENVDGSFTCQKCGAPLLLGLNLYRMLVEIRESTVKQDPFMVKQAILHMATGFTTEPANLGVEAPSSEGKTYPLVEVSRLFPDCWYLAGLSPTALAHSYGELVDLETRELLAPKIAALQAEIDSLNPRKSEDKQKIKELKRQLNVLMAKSAYLVDLEDKILMFLDKPHPKTLEYLRPILSHDVYECVHKFTDRKGKSGPLTTVTVILRGWPVAVFCRTQGEKDADNWLQTVSRFTTISPQMKPEKYREAIKLKALVRGLPGELLVKKLGLEREQWAKQALMKVRKELKRIKANVRQQAGYPKASMFWIPYHTKIGENFPADIGRRMRDSDRFLALLQSHAALNVFARPRLVFPNGAEYIVCTREDYEEITELFFSEEDKLTILTGLSRNVVEFFKKVVVPLYEEKGEVGLTVGELVDGCLKNLGKSLSDNTIRRYYLEPLSNAGFITYEEDPQDRRRKFVRVLRKDIGKTCENVYLKNALNFSFEELKEAWNELEKLCAHTSGIKIMHFDGRALTLEQLYGHFFAETSGEMHNIGNGSCARISTHVISSSNSENKPEKGCECETQANARNSSVDSLQIEGKTVVALHRLSSSRLFPTEKCALCGRQPVEWQADLTDKSWRLLCGECGFKLQKALEEKQ